MLQKLHQATDLTQEIYLVDKGCLRGRIRETQRERETEKQGRHGDSRTEQTDSKDIQMSHLAMR